MRVLFTGCTFDTKNLHRLKQKGIDVFNGETNYGEQELSDILKNYDCYINGGDEICTRKVIKSNQHLKLISFMGTGYQKYIDTEAAKDYGVPVSYTPSANAKAVAEYTVALILDAVKKITYSNNQVKNKEWTKYQTFNLENKTLGIIGMGAVGAYIAKILCDGFGMKLIYNSRTNKQDINTKYNTSMVPLDDIFKYADIISVNATFTEENKNMISKEQLIFANKNTILVNTARQELINKEDLYNAISKNRLGFVAMDGFYTEPIAKDADDAFLNLPDDKFLITPHNAYNSIDALKQMEDMLIESLIDALNNAKIRHAIN